MIYRVHYKEVVEKTYLVKADSMDEAEDKVRFDEDSKDVLLESWIIDESEFDYTDELHYSTEDIDELIEKFKVDYYCSHRSSYELIWDVPYSIFKKWGKSNDMSSLINMSPKGIRAKTVGDWYRSIMEAIEYQEEDNE